MLRALAVTFADLRYQLAPHKQALRPRIVRELSTPVTRHGLNVSVQGREYELPFPDPS